MNRAAAARPSGADAEPVGWELAAFEAAVHSDPVELAGAKRALKAFFFRLLPDIKVEDSFGEAVHFSHFCRPPTDSASHWRTKMAGVVVWVRGGAGAVVAQRA